MSYNHNTISAYTHDRSSGSSLHHVTLIVSRMVASVFSPLEAIAGCPVVNVTTHGVIVHVPYYVYAADGALTAQVVQGLQSSLGHVFNAPVSLHMVKLVQPYLDAHVLAAYLSQELATMTFTRAIAKLFTTLPLVTTDIARTCLPAAPVGVKVRLAGRLLMEKIRPRTTVQTATSGSLMQKGQCVRTSASHTEVNAKGVYTVQVTLTLATYGG